MHKFSLDNYKFLFSGETNFLRWYGNTLTIAVCIGALHSDCSLRELCTLQDAF